MNWEKSISSIYIIEDRIFDDGYSIIEIPHTFDSENIGLLKELIIESDELFKEINTVANELGFSSELEAFLEHNFDESIDLNDYVNFQSWYDSSGYLLIDSYILKKKGNYIEEYSFINNLNEAKVKIFNDYESAVDYIIKNGIPKEEGKVSLWLLDREMRGKDQDSEILNLLELISSNCDNSIGIVYSGKIHDISSREQVFSFVKQTLESNAPTNISDGIEELISEIDNKTLFLKNSNFKTELVKAVEQVYALKVDLNNLVWVMPKGGPVGDKIEEAIKNAKSGFDLYKLLNLHTLKQSESLSYALEQSTQLELSDINYLRAKSIEEGTNVSDTLLRVHDLYSNQLFKETLSSNPNYKRIIRNIESWGSAQGVEELHNQQKFEKLLTQEKFDLYVNDFQRPIMTGDIFEILHPSKNSESKKKYAMLLTQECDCVVREEGSNIKRKVEVATLIELTRRKIKPIIEPNTKVVGLFEQLEKGISVEGEPKESLQGILDELRSAYSEVSAAAATKTDGPTYRVTMAPFQYRDSKGRIGQEFENIHLYLRKVFHLDFSLLDLCTLNSTGEAMVDISKLEEIKISEVTLFPKHYQTHLIKILDKIAALAKDNSSTTLKDDVTIDERDVSKYVFNENILNYRLRRIGRLNMPYQSFTQAFFGLTQSNVGLPMDL